MLTSPHFMATKWSDSATSDGGDTDPSKQERGDDQYFDVLLLGKTGMGKSTTGNKLINSKSASQVIHRWEIEGEDKYLLVPKGEDGVPKRFEEGSDESITATTITCDLLSDESGELDGTRFRVLDVEGFASTNRGESCKQANLSILRRVMKIKHALKLRFSRVLYFLPVRGRLQKADYNIFEELHALNYFFGKSIFDSMIVVCTEDAMNDVITWPPPKMEHTKEAFSRVLHDVISQGRQPEYPDPPIVFLPHSATPDEVRKLIISTTVKCKLLDLKFRVGVCHRCALEFIHRKEETEHSTENRAEGKSSAVTCTTNTETVLYKESKCHPIIVTKYKGAEKFIASAVHVMTFGVTHAQRKKIGMPGFGTIRNRSNEWCPNCQKKPGHPGCIPVKTIYVYTPQGSVDRTNILVDHSDNIIEN